MSNSTILSQTRRGDQGLGKTAAGGNGGSYASHDRAPAAPIDRAVEDDYRQVLRMAQSMTNRMVTPGVGDRDDIAQEAVISIWKSSQSLGRTNIAQDHRKLIAPSVRGIISKHSNAQEHHTSHSGRVELDRVRQIREAELGRSLRWDEVEALAEEVRLTFAPGRRPKVGYHEGVVRPTSLQAIEDGDPEDDGSTPAIAVHEDRHAFEEDPESGDTKAYARLFETFVDEQDGKVKGARSRVVNALWGTFQQANPNIPDVQQLPRGRAGQLKEILPAEKHAAHAVASQWLDGSCDPAQEAALFAPFGGVDRLTIAQQTAVAERIGNDDSPKRGHLIWEAALTSGSES